MRCPRCFGTSLRDHVHVYLFGNEHADLRSDAGKLMQCRDCGWDAFGERFENKSPEGTLSVSSFGQVEEK